jgi:hypothetical protein
MSTCWSGSEYASSKPMTKDQLAHVIFDLCLVCSHRCLGYTKNEAAGEWENTNVFPKWREKYPNPPDLIGKQNHA